MDASISLQLRQAHGIAMPSFDPKANAMTKPVNTATAEIPDDIMQLIELFFFAYRDFVADPDAILADFGFGRAHHRVLHFVNRNPSITVSELLDILAITKQSLAPVLKQLVDDGLIEQIQGLDDRRQRLLRTTDKGRQLAYRLNAPQARRMAEALARLEPSAAQSARDFLSFMKNPQAL